MTVRLFRLPIELKISVSCFLLMMGYAYLFAFINLQINTRKADGDATGLATIQDIVVTYHGDRNQTLLGTKINGTMREYLPTEGDKIAIEQWIKNDRTEEEYLEIVQQLMDAYCTNCHPYGDRPDYPLETYEQVYQAAEPDQGPSIGKLAKFTHFHAFGMGVFAFLLSGIFAFTSFSPPLRYFGVVLPFLSISLDITAWWLTKLVSPAFAYVVYSAGLMTGASFAVTILGSLYDLWIRTSTVES